MEAAIGSEIADYLIKPVKPKQILLAIKKILDQKRLVTEKTSTDFRQDFNRISGLIDSARTCNEWADLFRKLIFWESELEKSGDRGMAEIFRMQENEANNLFSKFIAKNYFSWLNQKEPDDPVISPTLFSRKIFPKLSAGRPLFLILIDNMRFDQWKTISAELSGLFRIAEEEIYFSILPTVTQYSRNAIFAGLMPSQIEKLMPQYWLSDWEEEGKNTFEDELFRNQLARKGLKIKWSYNKLSSSADGRKLNEKLNQMLDNDLNIIVINFVDILSHARTDIGLIRDLAEDEPAIRSLIRSWFIHSTLYDLLKSLSEHRIRVLFTTDHGTIRVQNPIKVVGDKKTTSNLRYKNGRNLNYNPNEVFEITNPEKAMLPRENISSKYIFARNKDFLVYQNNFSHYAAFYKNTFQHGGISMQEMMLPFAVLEPISL
jgi:hypothetical protein